MYFDDAIHRIFIFVACLEFCKIKAGSISFILTYLCYLQFQFVNLGSEKIKKDDDIQLNDGSRQLDSNKHQTKLTQEFSMFHPVHL